MKLNKQYVRNYVSLGASFTEIIIAILILIGILLLSVRVVYDIWGIIQNIDNPTLMISTEQFLAHALELIIGVEFIKMLVKHTASSVVEVLVFTISRAILTFHTSMLDVLLGVIAIAILFGIRTFMSNVVQQSNINEFIVNAGFTVEEIKKRFGIFIEPIYGNTIAGIVANYAMKNGHILKPGYKVNINEHTFEVYAMDANLIKQVKIFTEKAVEHVK